mgnify:CR=1 FL=1
MCVFFQAEDGIRDLVRSRGLGDVYKRQDEADVRPGCGKPASRPHERATGAQAGDEMGDPLSLIHI